ncbi:MAG: MOSC domain-containing protein, partial [Deltaproteobacteria bacterium]|nr:MOSC domain-containing protein [Deltaproteobacteria bacterium]
IATAGIDWKNLTVGTRVKLGKSAEIEISQIGKQCHNRCAIYYQAGDCIMPKEGVFARVIAGGKIRCGDTVKPLLPKDIKNPR